MKTKNLLIAFLAGGLALASCNQTPKVPANNWTSSRPLSLSTVNF